MISSFLASNVFFNTELDTDQTVEDVLKEAVRKPRVLLISDDPRKLSVFLKLSHPDISVTRVVTYDSKAGGVQVSQRRELTCA